MFEVERGTTMAPKYQPVEEPIPVEPLPKPKNTDPEASEASSETPETVNAE
jgi:hypothetical protein